MHCPLYVFYCPMAAKCSTRPDGQHTRNTCRLKGAYSPVKSKPIVTKQAKAKSRH